MIEKTILSNLVLNEEYGRKVIPFLKPSYFQDRRDRILFNIIIDFSNKYKAFPSKETLHIELSNAKDLNEDDYKQIRQKIEDLQINEDTKIEWILTKTEEFCSWQAIKNALFQSIQIVEGKDEKHDKGSIPKILSEALAVSFDTNIGHDFLDNWV